MALCRSGGKPEIYTMHIFLCYMMSTNFGYKTVQASLCYYRTFDDLPELMEIELTHARTPS